MKQKTKIIMIILVCFAVVISSSIGIYEVVFKSNRIAETNKPISALDTSISIQRKDMRIKTYVANRMSGLIQNGYTIVMNNETGEIVALISVNDGKPDFFPAEDKRFEAHPISGSALKLLYSIPVIESGLDEMAIEDQGYIKIKTGEQIMNYKKTAYGITSFESALTNKSNVWFAAAFERIDKDKMADFHNRILLDGDIDIGFTTLKTSYDDSVNPIITASVGKGLSVDPIYMCAVLSGISNGTGKAMKPHFKNDMEPEEPVLLLKFTDYKTASRLCNHLKNCGRRHDMENTCFLIHYSESPNPGLVCYCANEDYTVLCSADSISSMDLEHIAYDILLRMIYT